jgi:hypothetical protein
MNAIFQMAQPVAIWCGRSSNTPPRTMRKSRLCIALATCLGAAGHVAHAATAIPGVMTVCSDCKSYADLWNYAYYYVQNTLRLGQNLPGYPASEVAHHDRRANGTKAPPCGSWNCSLTVGIYTISFLSFAAALIEVANG